MHRWAQPVSKEYMPPRARAHDSFRLPRSSRFARVTSESRSFRSYSPYQHDSFRLEVHRANARIVLVHFSSESAPTVATAHGESAHMYPTDRALCGRAAVAFGG